MIEGEDVVRTATYHRVHLSGRMLVRGQAEQACVLETVRGREAMFKTTLPGMVGRSGNAVAYVDLVGRIGGPAIFIDRNQIAVTIVAPQRKLERLSLQFALLASIPTGEREELRGHSRIIPESRDVSVRLWNEIVVNGRLRDVSRSGAAVEVQAVVVVGDPVVLGATRGRVSRAFKGGFAVQFARLLPLEQFSSRYRL